MEQNQSTQIQKQLLLPKAQTILPIIIMVRALMIIMIILMLQG